MAKLSIKALWSRGDCGTMAYLESNNYNFCILLNFANDVVFNILVMHTMILAMENSQ